MRSTSTRSKIAVRCRLSRIMRRRTIASLHLLSTLKATQNCVQCHHKTFSARNLYSVRETCIHATCSWVTNFSHTPVGIQSGSSMRPFVSIATGLGHGNLPVNQDTMNAVRNGSLLPVNQNDAKTKLDSKNDSPLHEERPDGSLLSVTLDSSSGSGILFEREGSDEDDALALDKDDSAEMDITLFGQLKKSETAIAMYRILNSERWSSPATEEKLSSVVSRLSPELLIEVIKLLKNAHMALSFLHWAKDQEGYEPRAEAYAHVIARFGRERDFNSAWRLFVEMKGCKLPIDYTFSIFLHRLKRAKRVQGLVKAVCGMKFLGVTPTIALYTSALEFLLKVGATDDATHLYKQMIQDALVPDKKLYEVLVLGFVKLGNLDNGLLLFNDMKNRGYVPHVSVYSELMSSMSAAKMLDRGHELFEEMLSTGCMPKVFGVGEIACMLHGRDTSEMAERFLKLVEKAPYKWKIQSLHNLLQCLFDCGRYKEAKAIFERVPHDEEAWQANGHRKDFVNSYWNLKSYHIYIIGMCKLRRFRHATDIFKELLERRLEPTNEISSFILLSLSNANMIDEALAFCKHITGSREPVSVDAQSSFFSALRMSGHLSVALKIFASMKRKGCIDQDADFISLIGLENKDDVVSLTE